tara:strand:+ start:3075 stop:4616 length:1542 start_codon:yes stop_codon:yes gene_type:complete
MQLSNEIKNTLKTYFSNIHKTVTLIKNTKPHDKKSELDSFLKEVSSLSDKVELIESDNSLSPMSFEVKSEIASNIIFSGIPGGHEFNSFILAILHAGGHNLTLDSGLKTLVEGIEDTLKFEVFVSLSCHNCPDVVQTLNQIAVLNDNVQVETIDGGLYQERINEYGIQGVPTVYLNGKPFATGKVEPSALVSKITDSFASNVSLNSTTETQDVTVIGGGPAGVAAAIYAARKGFTVTLLAERLGGQVKDTVAIENFISVPSTTGDKLTGNFASHLDDYDITVRENIRVKSVEYGEPHTLTLSTNEKLKTKTIIISTGAAWRKLGVEGEVEYTGNGVAYCPHCDGPFYKGKDVAVIGGGNSGIEAAIDLAGITKSVTVLEFAGELKADKVLVDKAERTPNISIKTNRATTSVNGDGNKVTSITVKDRQSNNDENIPVDGVFVQIGLLPNSLIFGSPLEKNQFGEIIIDERCRTNIKGVFACGDVTNVPYKQIIIAAGEGAKAALSAFDYIITSD